ncbi:acyl carrier protein [soil metagenome]
MDVEQQVRQFLVDSLRWQGSPASLTSDYPLIENDVLDSMAIFETIAYLEDQFGIEVQDDDLVPENFETIAAIARLVSTNQAR